MAVLGTSFIFFKFFLKLQVQFLKAKALYCLYVDFWILMKWIKRTQRWSRPHDYDIPIECLLDTDEIIHPKRWCLGLLWSLFRAQNFCCPQGNNCMDSEYACCAWVCARPKSRTHWKLGGFGMSWWSNMKVIVILFVEHIQMLFYSEHCWSNDPMVLVNQHSHFKIISQMLVENDWEYWEWVSSQMEFRWFLQIIFLSWSSFGTLRCRSQVQKQPKRRLRKPAWRNVACAAGTRAWRRFWRTWMWSVPPALDAAWAHWIPGPFPLLSSMRLHRCKPVQSNIEGKKGEAIGCNLN